MPKAVKRALWKEYEETRGAPQVFTDKELKKINGYCRDVVEKSMSK